MAPADATPQLADSTTDCIVIQHGSPIYQVLFNEDLFGPIVRIVLNIKGRGDHASVAALALTSRYMYTISVRVLWERMDDFLPLLKTVQGVTWEGPSSKGSSKDWTARLSDPSQGLASVDMTSFLRHCTYIKEFVFHSPFQSSIMELPAPFFIPKRSKLGPPPLLPCLRVLKCCATRPQFNFEIFGAPTLRRLDITASYNHAGWLISCLKKLPSRYPGLERLSIGTDVKRPVTGKRLLDHQPLYLAFKQSLAEFLHSPSSSQFRCLKTELPINWQDVRTLAQLPRFETLHAAADFADFKQSPGDLPEGSFASLRHLQLKLWFLDEAVLRILENIRSPVLESLDFTVWVNRYAPDVPGRRLAYRLFQLASLERFRDTLRRFRLHIVDNDTLSRPEDEPPVIYDLDTIEILRHVRSLERVSIVVPLFRYGRMNLRGFRTLAQAWRRLRKLVIYSNCGHSEYTIDVRTLWPFAFSPALEELGFNVISWDPDMHPDERLEPLKVDGKVVPRSDSVKRLSVPRIVSSAKEGRAFIREHVQWMFPNASVGGIRV